MTIPTPRPSRLTADEARILRQIADGWKPFPFQLSGLESGLLRRGLVDYATDENGKGILEITANGQAFIALRPAGV